MALLFLLFLLLATQTVSSEFGNYFHILKTCRFEGGGSQLDVLYRVQYHYNGRLHAQYNSSTETVTGFTPYGRSFADEVNSDAQYLLLRRNDLKFYCKVKGVLLHQAMQQKAVAPRVKLKMVQTKAVDSTLLVCSVYDFYPRDIRVTWLKNGKPFLQAAPQAAPQVARQAAPQAAPQASPQAATQAAPRADAQADAQADALADLQGSLLLSGPTSRNGPWRYQQISHLKYTPAVGETISCVVEHASLDEPKVYHLDLSALQTDQMLVVLGASLLILGAVVLLTGGGCYWSATR